MADSAWVWVAGQGWVRHKQPWVYNKTINGWQSARQVFRWKQGVGFVLVWERVQRYYVDNAWRPGGFNMNSELAAIPWNGAEVIEVYFRNCTFVGPKMWANTIGFGHAALFLINATARITLIFENTSLIGRGGVGGWGNSWNQDSAALPIVHGQPGGDAIQIAWAPNVRLVFNGTGRITGGGGGGGANYHNSGAGFGGGGGSGGGNGGVGGWDADGGTKMNGGLGAENIGNTGANGWALGDDRDGGGGGGLNYDGPGGSSPAGFPGFGGSGGGSGAGGFGGSGGGVGGTWSGTGGGNGGGDGGGGGGGGNGVYGGSAGTILNGTYVKGGGGAGGGPLGFWGTQPVLVGSPAQWLGSVKQRG